MGLAYQDNKSIDTIKNSKLHIITSHPNKCFEILLPLHNPHIFLQFSWTSFANADVFLDEHIPHNAYAGLQYPQLPFTQLSAQSTKCHISIKMMQQCLGLLISTEIKIHLYEVLDKTQVTYVSNSVIDSQPHHRKCSVLCQFPNICR